MDYYAGEFRDSDPRFPELIDYNVRVGAAFGVSATRVPSELDTFEKSTQLAVSRLDSGIGVGNKPKTAPDLGSVLLLAASVHGEWVRIHPFANGNGRTARLWGNWVLLRYALPPVLRIQPRPRGTSYADAAAHSMTGDHNRMASYIMDEIHNRI